MQQFRSLPKEEFKVVTSTTRSQAAVMVLQPGESTGGPDNRHISSDQWVYVTSGAGTATVEGITIDLKPGTLLLIEAGEAHEIVAGKEAPLETLDFYAPPEYPED